jgi:hypothetical protein
MRQGPAHPGIFNCESVIKCGGIFFKKKYKASVKEIKAQVGQSCILL